MSHGRPPAMHLMSPDDLPGARRAAHAVYFPPCGVQVVRSLVTDRPERVTCGRCEKWLRGKGQYRNLLEMRQKANGGEG